MFSYLHIQENLFLKSYLVFSIFWSVDIVDITMINNSIIFRCSFYMNVQKYT